MKFAKKFPQKKDTVSVKQLNLNALLQAMLIAKRIWLREIQLPYYVNLRRVGEGTAKEKSVMFEVEVAAKLVDQSTIFRLMIQFVMDIKSLIPQGEITAYAENIKTAEIFPPVFLEFTDEFYTIKKPTQDIASQIADMVDEARNGQLD